MSVEQLIAVVEEEGKPAHVEQEGMVSVGNNDLHGMKVESQPILTQGSVAGELSTVIRMHCLKVLKCQLVCW